MSNTPSTSSYRFVGGYTLVHEVVEMKEFGQKVELTDEQAETILRGGGLILPAAKMSAFFTDAELKEKSFPKFPGHWLSASADLKARRKAATALAAALHTDAVNEWDVAEKARVDAIVAERQIQFPTPVPMPIVPVPPVETETEKEVA